jgi:hypothetical protein
VSPVARYYSDVVPAKAGTHNHRARGSLTIVATSYPNNDCCNVLSQLKILGVWVPAFAGTTPKLVTRSVTL